MASQKVKGLSIVLSADTTAVSSALGEVNKSLNSTQKELNQVDKLLKLDPKNTTLLAQKQELLGKSIADTKTKLEQLNKVKELADKDDSVDKNSKQYRELITQIEQAKIKLNQFEQQSEDTGNALKDSGDKALSFGDILKGNLISEAIIGGVKALATAFKDIAVGLYDSVRESAKFADDVNTLAKQYNLTTKEIQGFIRAGELIDVDINTIGKSMSKLTKNMTSTTKETQNAFKTLGISVKESNGDIRDSNEVFYETIEALSKIENETEQDSLAMAIFGKSASDLGPLINGGAEQLKEFNKYLEENGLLLSQEELDGLNDTNDAFDKLAGTFDAVKDKIASQLAPVITPLIDSITKFVLDHKDDIVGIVQDIVDYLTSEEAKEMYQKVKETIEKVVKGVLQFIDDFPEIKKDLELLATPLQVIYDLAVGTVKAVKEFIDLLQGDYDFEAVKNSMANPYRRMGYESGGFGALQSGGFTSNLTINVNTNQNITKDVVRGWANIINEELGNQL